MGLTHGEGDRVAAMMTAVGGCFRRRGSPS